MTKTRAREGGASVFTFLMFLYISVSPSARSKNFKVKSEPKSPLSAVPNSRNSKTESFLFLFEKNRGR
ncbi:hypothetical protein L6274_03410, partial [Candidatus Parcubacteria bacterium]|nr:hypothetical protein [Candidatus Parcubacteria bacterium]